MSDGKLELDTLILAKKVYNMLNRIAISGGTYNDWIETVYTTDYVSRSEIPEYQGGMSSEIQFQEVVSNSATEGEASFVTKKELKDSNLVPVGAEFQIPLWISPNSQKFESVLNSVINNRAVKLKLPGSSSPVGSEEGFKIRDEKSLTAKEKKGIIFTESFTGKLTATHYADGTIKTAQVLLPSKFRRKVTRPNGAIEEELIDLSKHVIEKDGKYILDPELIDKELLTMFSFRIPTSSHQSGSTIEVVGFLPHEMGDLMIVPKDHVTQIGEDFDIDVRYYYKQNYIVS